MDALEFATRVGPSAFKRALLQLRPGDTVQVSRPMGGLPYDPERPAVLIAGGVGITPIRSILLQRETEASTVPAHLLFSNRHEEDIPFQGELSSVALRRPNVDIAWVLTSPASAAPDGGVHHGRISESLLRRHAERLPEARYYVAGSAAMVSDVSAMLVRVGVTRGSIRSVAQGRR
jgi:ferredoxin-NADP reductase